MFGMIEFQVTCNPAGIYLFKVNSKNTKTRCEMCSKLTINVFSVNFGHVIAGWEPS